MKRDCGEGELIPNHYEVHYHIDDSDKESKKIFNSFDEAEEFYDGLEIKTHGNARLYVCDKKRYCNCILSKHITSNGELKKWNR